MSPITTHVLDTSAGCPAQGVPVRLEIQNNDSWEIIGNGITNQDGRISDLLLPDTKLEHGIYRITFDTAVYFSARQIKGFYPYIAVIFEIESDRKHYHVPLLLNPFGYSTYRGS